MSRVLIVEDHADTQMLLEEVLRMKDFEGVAVPNAAAALESARSNPNLRGALVDLSLEVPIEDFLRDLRKIPGLETLPVTILSGQDWSEAKAKAVGAQSFLRKPCEFSALFQVLETF